MMAHQSKRRARKQHRPVLPPRQGSNSSFAKQQNNASTGEFLLISPLSDLSNPSYSAFHRNQSYTQQAPSSQQQQDGRHKFILENVPSHDKISKNKTHVLPNLQNVTEETRKQPKQKMKNRVHAIFSNNGILSKVRVQTQKAVKQTGKTVKQGATAVAKNVIPKPSAVPTAAKESSHETSLGHVQDTSHEATLGMAARRPEEVVADANNDTTLGPLDSSKDSYFETLWREQRAGGVSSYLHNRSIASYPNEGETPTIALDKAFADAVGLMHCEEDYFQRLAPGVAATEHEQQGEEEQESPRLQLNRLESPATVVQEDETCISYLISEGSASVALSKTGTVLQQRVSTDSNKSDPPGDDQTMRTMESLKNDDSIFMLQKKSTNEEESKRNSRASSNFIYSPETAEGASIASASLYTGNTKCNAYPVGSAVPSVTSSGVPGKASRPSSSEDMSPVQLMGELVSLASDKYSADSESNTGSPETSESSKSTMPSREQESASPTASCAESPYENDIFNKEPGHVRVASLASYSSLPTEQDTSAVPFVEEGVSLIAEQSLSKIQYEENTSSSDTSPEKDNLSAVHSCSDGSNTSSNQEHDEIEEVLLQQDDKSDIIVSIQELNETDDEDDESVDSESTLAGYVTKNADVPLDRNEESVVIVAIHELVESDDEGYDSESTLVGSPSPSMGEMPATRLSFPDESTAEETYQTVDESGTVQGTVVVEKVSEDVESVVESTSLAATEETPDKEEKQVVKTAVATGRVFAPRGPGELLISVNLSSLNAVDEDSVDSGLAALIDESSEQEEVSQETEPKEEMPVINLVANPTALHQEEKSNKTCDDEHSTSMNDESVLVDHESTVAMEPVQEEVACTVSQDTDEESTETVEVPVRDDDDDRSNGGPKFSEEVDLAMTKPEQKVDGFASNIKTLRSTKPPPRLVLETINSSPAPNKANASNENGLDEQKSSSILASPPIEVDQIEKRVAGPVVNLLAPSPSSNSVASSVGGSPMPLVSEQALANAAFLFSPSYANGRARLLKQADPPREMHLSTFAISTSQSRNRLSSFSARSRPGINIPVNSAPINMSSIRSSQSSYSYEGYTFSHGGITRHSNGESQITIDASRSSHDGSEKHVHFSKANECRVIRDSDTSRVALGTPVTVISPPSIDRKISDLTEATLPMRSSSDESSSPSPQRVASILQEIEEDGDTVDEADMSYHLGRVQEDEDDESVAECEMSWTYREEDGVLCAATPLRLNGKRGSQLAPTNSPMLRFHEARNKFSAEAETNAVRTSTSPTVMRTRPSGGSIGSVQSRVAELNDRLKSKRQPAWKNPRRETGGENALAPRQATLEASLFKNSVMMEPYNDDASAIEQSQGKQSIESHGYTVVSEETKSTTGVSTVISADVKSDTGVSTVVSADVSAAASDEDDDIFLQMVGSPPSPPPEERTFYGDTTLGYDEDDDEDDAFADMRRLSDTHPSFAVNKLRVSSGASLQSLLARDEQSQKQKKTFQKPPMGPLGASLRSIVSEDPSVLTFETEKENSREPSLGPKPVFKEHRATVNPLKQHAPGDLCLSPSRRTTVQAKKWRSLAAEAQEKDRAKKGSAKKRGLFKERSSNVMVGN